MARSTSITETEVLERLTRVFRDVGYAGASLAVLAEATGLKKASLYHRFPGGKEQMAREVLASVATWLEAHVLRPLQSDRLPAERIDEMIVKLDEFYAGGEDACLLNILVSGTGNGEPFAESVRWALEHWIAALTATLHDAGFDPSIAEERACRAVALVEGSLVVARGLRSTKPFQDCLASLKQELLSPARP